MACTALSSQLANGSCFSLQPKSSLSPLFISIQQHRLPKTSKRTKIMAQFGGGDNELKQDKKKFITREEEPEQFWQTAGERKGENPMMTPLPYIIIFGMSVPFIILAIGFANGWIKVPVR